MEPAIANNGRPPVINELPHLGVVIPMYQAQDHIGEVIRSIPPFVKTIVVVDDCSSDNSYARARAVPDPRVVFVRHAQNQGVGGAMLSGYNKAVELGVEIVIKLDADGQMDAEHILPLIRPVVAGEADYAKGNRFLHARELRAMPLGRRIGNLGLSFLSKLASGYWNIFDPTNGYTALRASVIPLLDQASISRRYFFETSLLLELSLLRAVVKDVYIPARYGDETSHLSKRKALREFPWRLFKGFLRRLWVQYFVCDFGVFSVFLISGLVMLLFGVIFGSYHWIRSARLNVSTDTGIIMMSVLPIILGVQCLLQAVVLDVQSTPTAPVSREIGWSAVLKQKLLNRADRNNRVGTAGGSPNQDGNP